MHELGIVFHVIKTIQQVGQEQGLQNVASVTLELGEVSGAVPHELESCWDWAVKRTELMPAAKNRNVLFCWMVFAASVDRIIPPCPKAAAVRIAAAKRRG